ncbi:MAG: class I SAM-dependent methyltransferase, partial [Deltaproteobacteria bacterium]|nr:class I SAM-dependent methyltransferase [Deltaproteobacteria bacterium]
GCGPGFFSIEMARMVGRAGRVIAVDLQEEMLQELRRKVQGTDLEERIILLRCGEDRIDIPREADFALAFYMVHEIPDQGRFFAQIEQSLKPDGQLLLAEPSFHVSKREFERTIQKAQEAGFCLLVRPKVFLSRAALLNKGS